MPELSGCELAEFVARAWPAKFCSMVRLPDDFEEDVAGGDSTRSWD